jgi:nucleotide-binding universal stress UspA family protein
MLKKILVPVRGDTVVETVLGHAAALAQRYGAHVVVVHCRARPNDLLPYSVPLPAFARETLRRQAHELAEQQEQQVREALHGLSEKIGLVESGPQAGTATVEVVEQYELMPDAIKHLGRLADLVVVAKPDRDRNVGTNSLKAGLFQTGRPVLMASREGDTPAALGARVAIGWNGSLEAARAVALTLGIVAGAEEVTILAGGKGEPHGATAEELVEYYRLRGIAARIERFEARHPGVALLEKTVELGANLLVMGAYGHSHERETLFGGNTQTIVDTAEIPVVLVH